MQQDEIEATVLGVWPETVFAMPFVEDGMRWLDAQGEHAERVPEAPGWTDPAVSWLDEPPGPRP